MATEPILAPSKDPKRLPLVAVFTDENRLVLSNEAVAQLQLHYGDYFEVQIEGDHIVLTPIRVPTEETIWAKIAALGITEKDVADAVKWARDSDGG